MPTQQVKTTVGDRGVIQQLDLNDSEFPVTVELKTLFTKDVNIRGDTTFSGSISFATNPFQTGSLLFGRDVTGSVDIITASLNCAVLLVSAAANTTVLVPEGYNGLRFYVKRTDNNPDYSLTVQGSGSVLIDRESSVEVAVQNTSLHLMFFNSGWWIL